MYKTKRIHYRSIFKSEDQNETVEYKSKGIVHIDKDTHIQFKSKGNLIHITFNKDKVILRNNDSILELSKDKEVWNQYQLAYGSVALKTKLLLFEESEDKVKIKYELYDETALISTVYILMTLMPCDIQEDL
ncbi:MAG: DUF1934 domain-containing protein [Coprobacillus sp.]